MSFLPFRRSGSTLGRFSLSRASTFVIFAPLAFALAQSPDDASSTADSVRPITSLRSSEGPWGRLESFPILLEPPETHLWSALYEEQSIWNFGELEQESVLELLGTLGFSGDSLAILRADGWWTSQRGQTTVELSDAFIESLSPENRAAVARWFRLNNPAFFGRLVVNMDGASYLAYENGGVSEKTLSLVKRLGFKRRNVLSLMDRPYILRQLGNDTAEKESFLKAAFATRALVVNLVIDESSDRNTMIDYWSGQGRYPAVASVLDSLFATAGTKRVDLVQLLPPLPRRYLYGFTNLSDVTPANTPDCFWTSIQFFKRSPSSRYLDPLLLKHHLTSDFEQVEGPATYGDIVCMFNNEDDSFAHSYVHIADDIVFTKNGASFARPFVLTTRNDMLSVYLDENLYRYDIYRRKPGT